MDMTNEELAKEIERLWRVINLMAEDLQEVLTLQGEIELEKILKGVRWPARYVPGSEKKG